MFFLEYLALQHRSVKQLIWALIDAFIGVFSVWVAFSLRLSSWWPGDFTDGMAVMAVVVALLSPVIFFLLRIYRVILHRLDLRLFITLGFGVALSVLVLFLVNVFIGIYFPSYYVPLSIPVIWGFVFWVFISLARMLSRSIYFSTLSKDLSQESVLIYGAGDAGFKLASSLRDSLNFKLVGFVDDDPHKIGYSSYGVKIYARTQLELLVKKKCVSRIFIAMPSVKNTKLKQLMLDLSHLPVELQAIPSIDKLFQGNLIEQAKKVSIHDVLGRDEVNNDPNLMNIAIKGKSILVTGAGGSIGSEICRQCCLCGAKALILLDHSEIALYKLEKLLIDLCKVNHLEVCLIPLLGSVREHDFLASVFKSYSVDTVFHAAAYKHVPMVEKNVIEGLANNVFGTLEVASLAVKNHCERFILISTDKAVRPTNIMGAGKRVSELVLHYLIDIHPQSKTIFSMVRFGNVLGSSGSVIPLFEKQIAEGGPVTVTDPEITRFFMTTHEAVSLVIQACGMAKGGEVFLLDMGEPVKINDLAKMMIHLSGNALKDELGEGGIEIIYTGLRPGEKLYEELLINDGNSETVHPKIFQAQENLHNIKIMRDFLEKFDECVRDRDEIKIKRLLASVVDGYSFND